MASATETATLQGLLFLAGALFREGSLSEKSLRQLGAMMEDAAGQAGAAEEQSAVSRIVSTAIDEIAADASSPRLGEAR